MRNSCSKLTPLIGPNNDPELSSSVDLHQYLGFFAENSMDRLIMSISNFGT
jgi:hypothetical protein